MATPKYNHAARPWQYVAGVAIMLGLFVGYIMAVTLLANTIIEPEVCYVEHQPCT